MNQSMLVGGLEVVAGVRRQLSKLGAFIEMQFCLLGYREIGRLHLAEVLAEETGQKVALTARLRFKAAARLASVCLCKEPFLSGGDIGYANLATDGKWVA